MAEPSPPAALLPPAPSGVSHSLVRLFESGDTIRLLAGAQLKAGNRDKLLGHLWSLLDPLLTLCVYYIVFGIGFRQAGDAPGEFVLYLFTGIVVWRFFGDSVGQSTASLRSHRGLILATDFPKAVIPIAICSARGIDLLWALAVVVGVGAMTGVAPSAALVFLPLVIATQLLLTLGACLFVARLGLFYADMANIVSALLRLWVLVSPIFYFARSEHGRHGIIPPDLIDYYMLNPIAGLLGAYRSVLIWGEPPDWSELSYVVGCGLVALVVGGFLFARGDGSFAKYV
jgi:ABC-type polysaccharide/polyol phosphate export permease